MKLTGDSELMLDSVAGSIVIAGLIIGLMGHFLLS